MRHYDHLHSVRPPMSVYLRKLLSNVVIQSHPVGRSSIHIPALLNIELLLLSSVPNVLVFSLLNRSGMGQARTKGPATGTCTVLSTAIMAL
jgi:hypothetical protein